MDLQALRELHAAVEAQSGKAYYPADEYDIKQVIATLNDTVEAILSALIAQEEQK